MVESTVVPPEDEDCWNKKPTKIAILIGFVKFIGISFCIGFLLGWLIFSSDGDGNEVKGEV